MFYTDNIIKKQVIQIYGHIGILHLYAATESNRYYTIQTKLIIRRVNQNSGHIFT